MSTQDKIAVEKELKVLEIEELNLDELDPDGYTADNIKVLKGMEGVRLRPGMYLQGGTGIDGFHQLLSEIVDNAIDECQAGYADTVTITIHKDEALTITDNGRGIPVDVMNAEGGRPAVEVVFTELHGGGKFDSSAYKVWALRP